MSSVKTILSWLVPFVCWFCFSAWMGHVVLSDKASAEDLEYLESTVEDLEKDHRRLESQVEDLESKIDELRSELDDLEWELRWR